MLGVQANIIVNFDDEEEMGEEHNEQDQVYKSSLIKIKTPHNEFSTVNNLEENGLLSARNNKEEKEDIKIIEEIIVVSEEERLRLIEIEAIKKDESTIFPKQKNFLVWLVFFLTVLCMLLQGAKGASSIAGIKKCGAVDWTIFGVYACVIFVIALYGSFIARTEEDRKVKAGWVFNKFELRWTAKRVMAANICAPIVGLCAAAVGLGGGVSLNPTLLTFGFQPMVVSATAMFLIMVSKLAAAILYVLAGKMPIGYWFFGGMFLVVASVIAQFQLKQVVKKLGRQSIISFIFVFFMAVSVVMIVLVGVLKAMKDIDDNKSLFKFGSPCDTD